MDGEDVVVRVGTAQAVVRAAGGLKAGGLTSEGDLLVDLRWRIRVGRGGADHERLEIAQATNRRRRALGAQRDRAVALADDDPEARAVPRPGTGAAPEHQPATLVKVHLGRLIDP